MCRLFGLSAAPRRITATFWLLAPDSLTVQSRHEPDGVGLGLFKPDGTAVVHQRPIAAYQDTESPGKPARYPAAPSSRTSATPAPAACAPRTPTRSCRTAGSSHTTG